MESEDRRPIKVVINGALGRAGRATIDILSRDPEVEIVGIVDLRVSENRFTLPADGSRVPSSSDLDNIITTCQPDVLVDFTEPSATMAAVQTATKRGVNLVIGTTGLTVDQLSEIDRMSRSAGVGALTGTLSLGVALVARLASMAANYFDYAEIVDLGKLEKLDAPSGAALDIANAMTKAKGKPFRSPPVPGDAAPCRGRQYDGVRIHSLRLSDCYIHEKIILGTEAGTLVTLGVELTSEAYLNPAIAIAVKEAGKHKGLVYGLDDLLLDSAKGEKA
jgi:4-hydroxy-tetrahydrodipicolinate reductase